jgi:hypothetical protein
MTARPISIFSNDDMTEASLETPATVAVGPAQAVDPTGHPNSLPDPAQPEPRIRLADEAVKPVSASPISWSPLLAMFVGAAAGATAAMLAVIVVVPRVAPPLDARLGPLADRVAAIELRQQQAELTVVRLNNQIAQLIESDGALKTGLEKQAAEFAEMQSLLAERVAMSPGTLSNTGLTVFAAAIGQLRAAFYSGRPFEAEIVTLHALADGDENVLALLSELAAPARWGVANAQTLRQRFSEDVSAAGFKLDSSRTYYDYGVSMLGEYIGYNSQPYSIELANVIVNEADRSLAAGDVAGAIGAIDSLDPASTSALQSWLTDANAHIRAEAAITQMTETIVERLRERMGPDNAS